MKSDGALRRPGGRDEDAAVAIARAVGSADPGLWLAGLAGSAQVEAGGALGLRVIEEAFADREEEADGSLRSRTVE